EAEKADTVQAVTDARDHIELDLHQEVQALRGEIRALHQLLEARQGVGGEATRTVASTDPAESPAAT
ncbi:MAG: hypothetical protein ACK46X_17860, partial [Candidatus Sericytochromatia bacterium]